MYPDLYLHHPPSHPTHTHTHDPLTTWSCKITWQTKFLITPTHQSGYDHQTWQDGSSPWWVAIIKSHDPLIMWVVYNSVIWGNSSGLKVWPNFHFYITPFFTFFPTKIGLLYQSDKILTQFLYSSHFLPFFSGATPMRSRSKPKPHSRNTHFLTSKEYYGNKYFILLNLLIKSLS